MKRRVVITGLGVVSSLGNTVADFWDNLVEGKSGIDYISKFDASDFECQVAGEVKDFDLTDYGIPKKLNRKIDDFTKYALATAKMCLDDSQLKLDEVDNREIGIFVGNCLGGVGFGERELYNLNRHGKDSVSPYQAISWFYTAAQGQISIYFDLKGFSKTYVADRISSDVALGSAYEALLLGRDKYALVCGAEGGMHEYGYLGFMKSNMITNHNSVDAYRPYDLTRNGLVLGEGSGCLMLETLESAEERGAKIYAEVLGYASTCDGKSYSDSDGTGEGLKRAILNCIENAGIQKEEIDYVNLDGCAKECDDIVELQVLKEVFGEQMDQIALSAPKASYGHTFGAAGAIDMVTNCLVINKGIVPPTINHSYKDEQCDLNITFNEKLERDVNVVLQIARGRGGINSATLIRRYDK